MEEILASIRRIIADEDTGKPKAAAPAPPPPPAPKPPQPAIVAARPAPPPPAGPAAAFRTIDAASDVFFTESPMDQRPPERPAPSPSDYQGLISNQTMSAVDSAFNSLAHTVLGNNARTLEDLVKEMLRPMLKGWLDDNLPNMVERIVRAEIERVSRGRS